MRKVKWQVTCNEDLGTFGAHFTLKGKEFDATLESQWFHSDALPKVGVIAWRLVVWIDGETFFSTHYDDLSDAIARADEIYNDPEL